MPRPAQGENELWSIAGFPRKLYYGKEDGEAILTKHVEVADEYKVDTPYYESAGIDRKMQIVCDLPDGVRVRVGEIGAYTPIELAIWVNEQVNIYVKAGTMGKFDDSDERKCRELTAAMIGGIDSTRVVVTFDKAGEEGCTPVAGVQAYRGKGIRTLWEAITTGETDSIGSLTALQVDTDNRAIAFLNLRERYGKVREKDIVGMSRLWRAENEKMKEMEISITELPWMAMAFLILGIAKPVLHGTTNDTAPEVFIYDTSTKIQTELARIFKMREVVDKTHLKPTNQVLSTVLGQHYRDWEGDLIIGEVAFGKYLVSAWTYLLDRGIDVPKIMGMRYE